MALHIVTAEERLSQRYNKTTGVIVGRAKVGKTSLANTLPAGWIFTDMEAGMKSVHRQDIVSVPIETFDDAQNLACIIAGPDRSLPDTETYSQAHYDSVSRAYSSLGLQNYLGSYWDSITDLTRLAMTWAGMRPEAKNKYGVKDSRAQYGIMGREVIKLLRHVQHAHGKSCFFVGGLEEYEENGTVKYRLQTEGAKAGNELPFIVDQVITMSDFDYQDGQFYHNFGRGRVRALCCTSPNPWGLPAGDRSGKLNLIEEPHLARLLDKINRR